MSDVGLAGQQGDSQEDIDVQNVLSEGEELGDEQNVKIQQEEQDKGVLYQHPKQNLDQSRAILTFLSGFLIGPTICLSCVIARFIRETCRGNDCTGW